MSDLAALERRLDELESREAIRELVYRTTELIRAGRMHEGSGLFTPDAVWELHYGVPDRLGETVFRSRREGPEAIVGSFEENAGVGTQIWPMIHNLRIEVDGDEARSTCVLMTAIWPHGHQMVGEYRDRFQRNGEGWRFAARTYVLFGDVHGRYAAEADEDYVAAAGTDPN